MRRTKTLVESSQRRRGSLIFGNNLPNLDQGSMFGRILPPLNGEFEFLGEFGGGFVPGASGRETSVAGASAAAGASAGAVTSAATVDSSAAAGTASWRTSGAASKRNQNP
jgi:hypothetical protein